ncbi:hypothetical protein [Micromonospora peucetia]|uniref:Recombination endonuclease VII n=1 Tax=Micromonospora peucetia TaxID=47871 RepID=A0ABZ1EJU1_9ACTN|nr:hypothetical protein [Micromonospora peucetia]WSA34538.1 hypothetical protein OIE14_11090 [Micromonospora peucetia]
MPKAKTTARGYGHQHQKLREHWRPKVETGLVDCARCGQHIGADDPWDLGHTDDRTAYTGPECRTCNRSAGGRHGAAVTNGKRVELRHSRHW